MSNTMTTICKYVGLYAIAKTAADVTFVSGKKIYKKLKKNNHRNHKHHSSKH